MEPQGLKKRYKKHIIALPKPHKSLGTTWWGDGFARTYLTFAWLYTEQFSTRVCLVCTCCSSTLNPIS